MIQLQRLNLDSSWHITWRDTSFVLDPWLIGSEVDGYRWLNEQWHILDPVTPDDLPPWDFTVVSQSYSDHCHPETLRYMASLKPRGPVLVSGKAHKRLRKELPSAELSLLPELTDDEDGGLEMGGLRFATLHPGRRIDPIYYGLLISDQAGRAIFYCPHGFELSARQLERIKAFDIEVLMTTFTEFRLPAWLGGLVNPGREQAEKLATTLAPKYVINTHDERKRAKGLVSRFAKVRYVDEASLATHPDLRFVHTPDYRPVTLS